MKAKTVALGLLTVLGLAACDMTEQSATGPDVEPSFAKKTGFATSAPLQASHLCVRARRS